MATFLMLLGGPDHHDRWDALPEDAMQKAYEGFAAFAKATQERGVILAGDGLMRPSESRTLHADGTVTDGPFAEAVEQLGGFYVIDVPTMDDAIELARLLPKQFAATDIRPCMGVPIR